MRWMMNRWWCEGGGDRVWWVIESDFLRSPDKGFWACLGDLPPDMPRRLETWVSLCNLMLKLSEISHSRVGGKSIRKMRPKTLSILEVLGWYFYDLETLEEEFYKFVKILNTHYPSSKLCSTPVVVESGNAMSGVLDAGNQIQIPTTHNWDSTNSIYYIVC